MKRKGSQQKSTGEEGWEKERGKEPRAREGRGGWEKRAKRRGQGKTNRAGGLSRRTVKKPVEQETGMR